MPDGVLPYDKQLGLPQRQRVKINNVAYDLFYSWNSQGQFVRLKIVRVQDGVTVFNIKLVSLNPLNVRDPSTYEVLFTLMPYKISREDLEIWVFWGE